MKQEQESPSTLMASLLGPGLYQSAPMQRLFGLSPTLRLAGGAALLAALVLVPYLGAVGLWDPWETHYGEVARSMIQRSDYVFPYWENAWFFSKPAMTLWLMALGMNLVGANSGDGTMGLYTEWGMRLPFVALSIAAVALMALAVGRVVSRRAGFATALVMVTMPMYFLLSRQAVTDTPFVTAFVCAMACAIIGQLDTTTKHRAGWWYAFYVFCAIATLAKGLLGVGLAAVILFLYAVLCVIPWTGEEVRKHAQWLAKHAVVPALVSLGVAVLVGGLSVGVLRAVSTADLPAHRTVVTVVAGFIAFTAGLVTAAVMLGGVARRAGQMPALWAQFFRMRLSSGIAVFFAIAGPWYAVMSLFAGVDDESKVFWLRFFVHDHLNRLAAGVHTTTPGGTFTYFIEQAGFGIFPWVALVPGALAVVARLRVRGGAPADHVGVIAAIWVVFTFALLGASQTKFHHYVFPVLPGLAILMALFIDKLWQEGVARHAVVLLAGLALFILVGKDLATNPKNFTDLFVYNYDRPYPQDLVNKTLSLFNVRALWIGDVYAAFFLSVGGFLTWERFTDKKATAWGRTLGMGLLLTGVAFLLTVWLRGRGSPGLFLGLGTLFTALYLGWEASKEKKHPGGMWAVTVLLALVGLVLLSSGVGGRDRLIPVVLQEANLKRVLGHAFFLAGACLLVAAMLRARTAMFATFLVLALGFAGWFNWSHWPDLSHHWTQRDLFWKYHALRGGPDEPITAYMMNWRGETFYSKNRVKQIKDNTRMSHYVAQPGRKWALVEHNRLGMLKNTAGPSRTVTTHTTAETNNKFVLVSIE